MLLKNSNRKPYTIFRMVPLSMTLSDLWPDFKVMIFFLKSNIVKTAPLKDKVTIAQEETIPIIWNCTMFGDLDWLLNASRGFVSISWASCFIILVTHPKSYIETSDRRDFGGKPSKWRWGRVLSWKIPEFYSVGGARSKKQHFSRFRVPFDYPAHSLHGTVLPQTNGTDGKPRLWRCAFC